MWSRLALLAAGAIAGSAATRAASDPAARQSLARRLQGNSVSTEVTRASRGDVERRPGPRALQTLQGAAQRFGAFAARVRAGMDEREAQLREQFGVRTPVDHTANHPGPTDDAGVPWHSVATHDSSSAPEELRGRTIDHTPSEGNER